MATIASGNVFISENTNMNPAVASSGQTAGVKTPEPAAPVVYLHRRG
jgi:hypothetical protein